MKYTLKFGHVKTVHVGKTKQEDVKRILQLQRINRICESQRERERLTKVGIEFYECWNGAN